MSKAHLLSRSLTSTKESSQQLTVLITGCTSGIGEALAREFARQGHNIVGCGRRLKNLENLSNELGRNSFGQHHFFQCDVGDYNSVVRFREKVRANGLEVDILIANAGIAIRPGRLYEISLQEFNKIMKINVTGVFHTFKAFVGDMVAASQKPGSPLKRVIGISSGLAHSTSPVMGPYSVSKIAVEYMCKSMAQLFHFEDKENIICVPYAPGVVTTEMMRDKNNSIPSDEWSKKAVPFILTWKPEQNGASMVTPHAYSKEYQSTWIIPDGMPISTRVVRPSSNDN